MECIHKHIHLLSSENCRTWKNIFKLIHDLSFAYAILIRNVHLYIRIYVYIEKVIKTTQSN